MIPEIRTQMGMRVSNPGLPMYVSSSVALPSCVLDEIARPLFDDARCRFLPSRTSRMGHRTPSGVRAALGDP
jgi:hypothetical protein